jgi:hypothetical protein
MTHLNFGEHRSLVEGMLIKSFDEFVALEAKSIAFYGGTFNPPHFGC